MDAGIDNRECIRRPQQMMLQDWSDEDRMHYNQNEATCEATPISTEDCFRNHVWKSNKQQSHNKLSELIGKFGRIHDDEQVDKMEIETLMVVIVASVLLALIN